MSTEPVNKNKISYSDIVRFMNNQPKKNAKIYPVEHDRLSPESSSPRWKYMDVEEFYRLMDNETPNCVMSPLIEQQSTKK